MPVPRLTPLILFGFLLAMPASSSEPHWSFLPRTRPAVPTVPEGEARAWVRTDVDAFILARLRAKGLRPGPEADRTTLLRRLTFDLTGLPPTPAEVADFLGDTRPDAYERLVERLLASTHYGERWGQHWLDVVRFAESDGFEYDRYRPGMWRYRDYVIRSLNEDKPFDRFLTEHLAGDVLAAGDPEMHVAAGFHRLGPVRRNAGNQDVAFSRNEVLTEMTDAVGMVFLGLTVGCARCHDHKFDEFSQVDYYRLQAFLAAVQEHSIDLADAAAQEERRRRLAPIEAELKRLRREVLDADGATMTILQDKIEDAERRIPPPLPCVCTVRDEAGEKNVIHVLKRGNPEKKGPRVEPGFPSALSTRAADISRGENPRVTLANWLADPEHPLTARVLVNRVWHYHFGRGLVETPNDFGVNGARPSHPELLDHLANTFVQGGMRLKALHRLIVLSSTYRQTSRAPEDMVRLDPENRLLGRFPRRRLSAEEVRDAMLAVSGRLNRKAGGESVMVPAEKDLVNLLYDPTQWKITADPLEHDRRSIYLIAKRNLRLPFGQAFDQPDLQTSCAKRETSTHALQALELLNGTTSNRLARALAERLHREAGPSDPTRQVDLAYRLALGRPPSAAEAELASRFLAENPLRELALALFNTNTFLYVD